MPEMKATPAKSDALAWLMSKLQGADEFARKPFGYDNPPVAILSDLLGIPGVLKTGERVAYGEPLTSGKGWTTRMKPETEEALMAAPMLMDMPLSPLRAIATLPRSVARAAGDFARASAIPATNVVKAKGGNWIDGSVENALKGLKRNPEFHPDFEHDVVTLPDGRRLSQTTGEVLPPVNALTPDTALNNWIDKQLTRYVKNDMATPEDPVRALAERGVLHVNPDDLNFRRESLGTQIHKGQTHYAQTPTAGMWEGASDLTIAPELAGVRAESANAARAKQGLEPHPWLGKIDPNTPVYDIEEANHFSRDVGFRHLIDELRNATNPASGLPRELLLKYESLPQVSVPQAVQRVHDINAWRAAQKAEADMARANNAATVLHKEYPNKGFKWVELKAPEDEEAFASGARAALDPNTGDMRGAGYKALEDALKYEGDTMGHCVGGYCPDVLEGRSRIFSLRSAKGEPHVTIEVAPKRNYGRMEEGNQLGEDYLESLFGAANKDPELNKLIEYGDMDTPEIIARLQSNHPEVYNKHFNIEEPPSIVQIKGKQNRAPNPEYLPFVQDFVKSGKWSDVGDLQNTGLVEYTKGRQTVPQGLTGRTTMGVPFEDVGIPEGYYTNDELLDLMRGWQERSGNKPNFAAGGVVTASQTGYNPQRVDELVTQLSAELFPQ